MLNNATIRLRVILAFAIVLCATLGLGLFSIIKLSGVNTAAADVATNWLPSATVLGDMSQDFEQMRLRQMQVATLTGAEKEEALGKVKQSKIIMAKNVEAYTPLINGEEERGLADDMLKAIATYDSMTDTFMSLVDSGDTVGATTYFLGPLQDNAQIVRKTIRANRKFQLEKGTIAAQAGITLGKAAITMIAIALGVTALICFVIGLAMIRGISVPITHMSQVMSQLAKGDTSVRIPNVGERSEIGVMAGTVEVFKDGMIRNRALEAETRQAREDAEVQRKKTMRDLADQFEGAVGGIVQMVSSAATEMQATASQLTSNAHEAAAQATSVSAAAEEAGTNVTSVAGSAEELGASVQEISRQVEHSSQKAREAVAEADATAAIVNELSEAAGKINGIVEMISGIASQTNLLALNATIESARAGEAGKGFAVVASEVKTLAGQTSKATADINAQITAIQATTQRAVDAIQNITGTIRDINDSSATIAAAVEQQGSATNEIVQAVNQASMGTTEVTSNITGVARMAEETGAGAAQVLAASGELATQAGNLRTQIDNFLAHVRSA